MLSYLLFCVLAACASDLYRNEKNFATPLYSARGRSLSSHSVAPPMMVFCGAPATSGQYGIKPVPTSHFELALMSARVADEPMKMPHSPFWKRGSGDFARPPLQK